MNWWSTFNQFIRWWRRTNALSANVERLSILHWSSICWPYIARTECSCAPNLGRRSTNRSSINLSRRLASTSRRRRCRRRFSPAATPSSRVIGRLSTIAVSVWRVTRSTHTTESMRSTGMMWRFSSSARIAGRCRTQTTCWGVTSSSPTASWKMRCSATSARTRTRYLRTPNCWNYTSSIRWDTSITSIARLSKWSATRNDISFFLLLIMYEDEES